MDSFICVYFDDREVLRRKKKILSPGEMEELVLKKKDIQADNNIKKIIIKTEK
jgi:hypothetical protein